MLALLLASLLRTTTIIGPGPWKTLIWSTGHYPASRPLRFNDQLTLSASNLIKQFYTIKTSYLQFSKQYASKANKQ